MSPVLTFKRYVTVTAVDGDAVYLTSERGGRTRLQGSAMTAVAPLLDGTRGRAEITGRLADSGLAPEYAERLLDKLLASGHVVESESGHDRRAVGYWELAGANGDAAVRAVRTGRVDLLSLSAQPVTDLIGRFSAEHIAVQRIVDPSQVDATGSAGLTVVVADDYRDPELRAVNDSAVAAGTSWLLAKLVGSTLWIGPVFQPGVTACYECLRVRLTGKSLTESYLRQRGALSGALVESTADLPVTRALGGDLVVSLAAQFLAGVAGRADEFGAPADPARLGDVLTFDTFSLTTRRHRLDSRPQCPVCGDPNLQAAQGDRPVTLTRRPKVRTSDGGHRAMSQEDFVARYERFVSPITGPISHLAKLPLDLPGIHTYTAGQNFAIPMRSVADLRAGLRSASCGKGISDIQAKASALGEAIERYSCVFHGDERRVVSSFADFDPADVIEPNDVHLYSDSQFRDQADWNARPSHFHWVGEKLDPEKKVEWSPVWSLTEQRQKFLPTSMLYFSYGSAEHPFHCGANSNGCAAGSSLEDAIVQGFMELVERDAVALWWYNRTRHPAIDLSTFDNPYFAHWQQTYASLDRQTWVLDITTDLGIPTVVAVSYRTDKPVQDILFALGSHFDVDIAIGRALSEMNQFLPAVIGMKADGTGRYAFDDPAQVEWWQTAKIEDHPYLAPAGPARTKADFPYTPTTDLADDVRRAQAVVERAGLEMLVLDHTRPDIGLPVARVIVPGLRHFWPRYAPGRLFDVPVASGLVERTLAEDELNPIAMFL